MPYTSLYWIDKQSVDEGKGFLFTGGFEEFPVPTARYQTIEGSPYGKGPGWYAEGDARMLQIMKKDFLTAVELMVKPPMKGPAIVGDIGGVDLIPGGYTNVNSTGTNPTVEPLFQVPGNPEWLATSHLTRGAWIEINISCRHSLKTIVAPHTRCMGGILVCE